ncbi:MAG: hypothetical protein H6658_09740 [Ardenticatenaceae bacterium]|nr:hypothetical protein [Ardenticatenaceae bacterium]
MTKSQKKRTQTTRSPFGALLQEYRLRSRNPDNDGRLTQEKVLDLLVELANLPVYASVQMSRWEKGGQKGRVIPHEDRALLVGLIQVLHHCQGITSLGEANALLQAGGYKDLGDEEIAQVEPDWLKQESEEVQGQVVVINGRSPKLAPTPAIIPPRHVPTSALSTPFMVPAIPPQGIFGRDEILAKIMGLLQLEETKQNVSPLALRGMGGIGKTTLTLALGRLEGMRQHFPDGILWIALGPNPTIRFLQEDWGRALGLDLLPERDENSCRHRLQEALYHRQALLIVDDVWEIQHGKQFEVAGPACRLVLTTREPDIAHHFATPDRTIKVDILSSDASLQLLQGLMQRSVALNEKVARQLCERLEYLPLALTLAGRMLANETDIPARLQRLVDELLERREARLKLLQAEGRLGIDEENPVSLQAILGLSVDRLSPVEKERFAMSAVFGGEPLTWQLDMAAHVWDCSQAEAEDTVAQFMRRGLVYAQGNGRYWMHALLADYAQEMMDEMGL